MPFNNRYANKIPVSLFLQTITQTECASNVFVCWAMYLFCFGWLGMMRSQESPGAASLTRRASEASAELSTVEPTTTSTDSLRVFSSTLSWLVCWERAIYLPHSSFSWLSCWDPCGQVDWAEQPRLRAYYFPLFITQRFYYFISFFKRVLLAEPDYILYVFSSYTYTSVEKGLMWEHNVAIWSF